MFSNNQPVLVLVSFVSCFQKIGNLVSFQSIVLLCTKNAGQKSQMSDQSTQKLDVIRWVSWSTSYNRCFYVLCGKEYCIAYWCDGTFNNKRIYSQGVTLFLLIRRKEKHKRFDYFLWQGKYTIGFSTQQYLYKNTVHFPSSSFIKMRKNLRKYLFCKKMFYEKSRFCVAKNWCI